MKLTHIALHVPDSQVCANWYADYCGMVEVRRHSVKEKPVSYYCGVPDPAGNQVEFSYGQPLG